MVQALISISHKTNRVLNIVKAKYGLRDKSRAIERVVEEFDKRILEPELRPEFVEEMKKIDKQQTVKVKNVKQLFK